ncbi:MAG TPA: hypothetical protein VEU33_05790 [Archangium sp.]|nr:hypothetical protein [Archangium sp.]
MISREKPRKLTICSDRFPNPTTQGWSTVPGALGLLGGPAATQPSKKREVPLSLLAAVPGTYTGPASRAYRYYADEHKRWRDGLEVSIAPRW